MEAEVRGTHDVGKRTPIAISELVSRKNGIEINPFSKGLLLLKNFQHQANGFESSSKHCNEYDKY